jgi:hypothetical protein
LSQSKCVFKHNLLLIPFGQLISMECAVPGSGKVNWPRFT